MNWLKSFFLGAVSRSPRALGGAALAAFIALGGAASLYVQSLPHVTERTLGSAAGSEEEEEEEGGLRPDSPAEWARFRKLQQKDENGLVDRNGAVKAMAKRNTMVRPGTLPGLVAAGSGKAGITAPLAAGVSSGSWSWIGPGNIGGRVRALSIDPTNASKILAGSAGGGIWSSANGGASWTPVADFLASLAVGTIARSAAAPNVVYAGTGEGFYNCDSLPGAGIFKSTNGGATWAQLSATNPANNIDWLQVNRITVHPTNPSIILAATGGVSTGVRCSDNNSSAGGLYRSTDAGVTWTKVFSTASVVDARFQPTVGTNAIISVRVGFYNYAMYYSNDAGASWTLSSLTSTNSGGRKEIAYSGTTAFISVDNSSSGTSGQVWSSTDGGANWTLRGTPNHLNGQGWYSNAIWADPTNAQHLIVGGLDLWRTTNGGTSWTQISDWTAAPSSAHADHQVIVSSPGFGTSDRTIYFGNDGGIYKTADIQAVTSTTTGWTSLNNGLGVTQFYDGAGLMVGGTSPLIVGGTQDNGSLVYLNNGTTDWQQYYGGDGGFAAVDVSTPSQTHVYGEYVYLSIHRADRLDNSLTGGTYATQDIYYGIGDAFSNALFIAPFTLDPNNPAIMYAGGGSLWRSTNVNGASPTWASVASSGSLVSQIAVAEGSSNNVWFGTTAGQVFSSTTATPAFTSRSTGLPGRMVLALLIDKGAPSTVYAGFGGYSASNLYRTTNGGASWTNIHGNLPAVPIYTIQRHPTNANYLYVGTEVGVFASEDGGATWSTTNDGPANVAVMKLFWLNSSTLVAATHGRGMYTANVAVSSGTLLSVQRSGTGSGTVTSLPSGINCGAVCSATYTTGTSVTLTATPNSISTFTGWSGACSGTGTCTVAMTAAASVTATFTQSATIYGLTVTRAGSGTGTVSSSPSGIDCGTTCTASFVSGASVTLGATPATGSSFTGWSGACTGTGTCTVTMSAASAVTATFDSSLAGGTTPLQNGVAVSGLAGATNAQQYFSIDLPSGASNLVVSTSGGTGDMDLYVLYGQIPTLSAWDCRPYPVGNDESCTTAAPSAGTYYIMLNGYAAYTGVTLVASYTAENTLRTLTVSKGGAGTGTVASSPTGINCGTTCSATFASGTSVVLTATPAAGSTFAGWSGDCSGSSTCALAMSADYAATATFDVIPTYALSVSLGGTGSGTVSSLPAGISCGSTCTASFTSGTTVTLSATPAAGSTFAGWTGACSGNAACTVTMSEIKSVTATFTKIITYSLSVSRSGTGSGMVSSSPAGVSCGVGCSATFVSGTSVTLTATAATGSTFTGWTGACTGTGACVVTMSGDRTVAATFTQITSYPLSLVFGGTGSGSVSSSPAGISCTSSCSAQFAAGANVILTATPASGSLFSGWSGACSGSGTCTVAMSAARSVTATFTKGTVYALTVSRSGTGSGTVSSTPTGISCGSACTASFVSGTSVTLRAVAASGSSFSGWSGACTGTGTCTVAMSAASSVTATFARIVTYAVTVTRAGTGTGTVTSLPAGISCGSTCSTSFNSGASVTLTAAAASGSTFTGWSGGCTGTSTCVLTVNAAKSVTATFALQTYVLSIAKVGAGTVTSSPTGISCGAICSMFVTSGTSVVLTASPSTGFTFNGWSGACSGTGTCTVAMTAAKSVTANFVSSSGGGTVLQNGVPVAIASAALDSSRSFTITVPTGNTTLTISTTGSTGDADLYVRFGQAPTVGVLLDCAPYTTSSTETCTFSPPVAGTYYVLVHAYAAYTNLSLNAVYGATAAGLRPGTAGRSPVTGSGGGPAKTRPISGSVRP